MSAFLVAGFIHPDYVSVIVFPQGQLSSLQNPKNVEKVNMVYLKNIVVKYMAYADDAPEKQFMRRVIATLLQFNSEDEDFLQHAPIPGGVVKQALEPQESG
eukprot:gb/GECG01002563.1/.p1 GENE.gb/GECG01002563.1/~~gb/GECG01002563.1/.p1  ORF type:complete len:101 (+),score=14.66 gb/GECG01002563.1/:1-303(+)